MVLTKNTLKMKYLLVMTNDKYHTNNSNIHTHKHTHAHKHTQTNTHMHTNTLACVQFSNDGEDNNKKDDKSQLGSGADQSGKQEWA